MKTLPGSKQWSASMVGYVQVTDWDFNNGGVLLFNDGTMWSYESESPAAGGYDFFPRGIAITERAAGSEVWERLTPDVWGAPWAGDPPGHSNWPSNFFGDGDIEARDREGALNVATIGNFVEDWCAVKYPDDENVLFYPRFGGDGYFGPVTVNRYTRRWKTHMTAATASYWGDIASNVVLYDGHFYWFTEPGTSANFLRCPVSDPNQISLLKTWDASLSWSTGLHTPSLALPDFIDNQKLPLSASGITFTIDDGYVRFFSSDNLVLIDSRTTGPPYTNGDTSERNYNIKYSTLRGFQIGVFDLELLYWHSMPQGWVGYGGANYGTVLNDTIGVFNYPDQSLLRSNDAEALGMGFRPSQYTPRIHDGWLYWVDWSANAYIGFNATKGPGHLVCRINLALLDPTLPIHHDPYNPAFEILTNATAPWESDVAHIGYYNPTGTWLWSRLGAQPLLPYPDIDAMTFDADGNILYKCMGHPQYYRGSDGGGYGTRQIIKLSNSSTNSDSPAVEVAVNFYGDELKGYGNVRQVPITRDVIEVELS